MSRIKEIVENLKAYLELIKWALIAVFALSTIFGWGLADRMKAQAEKFKTIAKTQEVQFQNELGQKANEVQSWKLSYNDLEDAFIKKEGERSAFERKLVKAKQTIDLYKRKEKDLISYSSATIRSRDTVFVELPNECIGRIEPIRTAHLEVEFSGQQFIYSYQTDISTMVTLYPKRKANGKKHFPNWGFIWGWEQKAITTVDDPNAEIFNAVSIDFQK